MVFSDAIRSPIFAINIKCRPDPAQTNTDSRIVVSCGLHPNPFRGERRTTREVAFLWPAGTNLCRAAQEFIRLVKELQGWLKVVPAQFRA
jgi:hypothetical protein